jgi:hypothetical protein
MRAQEKGKQTDTKGGKEKEPLKPTPVPAKGTPPPKGKESTSPPAKGGKIDKKNQ